MVLRTKPRTFYYVRQALCQLTYILNVHSVYGMIPLVHVFSFAFESYSLVDDTFNHVFSFAFESCSLLGREMTYLPQDTQDIVVRTCENIPLGNGMVLLIDLEVWGLTGTIYVALI